MQRPDAMPFVLRRAGRLALAAVLSSAAVLAAPDPTVSSQSKPPPGVRAGGDGVGGIEKTAGNQPGAPSSSNGGTPTSGGTTLAATEEATGSGWSDLGGELSGSDLPRLQAVGGLQPGGALTLLASDARPFAPAALVLGTSTADLPFKGGFLVPRPDLVLTGLTIDAAGGLVLQATMPDMLPAGATVCLQLWMVDPLGPQGFAATNALLYIAP